jgi:hypothetical protein
VLKGAEAGLSHTGWPEFRELDLNYLRKIDQFPAAIDSPNLDHLRTGD